jgi:hypothetical protein
LEVPQESVLLAMVLVQQVLLVLVLQQVLEAA